MSKQNRPADPDPVGSAVRTATRPKMTPHEIGFMIAVAIRSPYVYLCAKDHLSDTNLFETDEAKYVLLLRASFAAFEANKGSLPPDAVTAKEIIASHCAAEVATDVPKRYYTSNVERDVLMEGGLLEASFSLPIDQAVEGRGIDLLGKFVLERKIGDPLRRALAGISSQETIADPSAIIAALEKHACSVGGISDDPGSDAFVDTLDILPPGAQVTTTGVRGLDELLNGGHAPKEAYVLMAPTSGGKSALATQIAIEGAKMQAALAAEVGSDRAGYWFYFTWELSLAELRARMYGYAARIHGDSFKEDPITRRTGSLSTVEDSLTLKAYESDPYVNSPGNPVRGERERLREANRMMTGINSRLIIIDYSKAGVGGGGVDEVARYLHREKSRGRQAAGVVIDYAGLVVQRYCDHHNLKPSEEHVLLSRFVNEVRSKVSNPYNCPAWVLHQLHGDASRRAPGLAAHHSEARGCRNFSDNADFSIQMGNRVHSTGAMQLKATKHRRAAGRDDGVIVRFDGRFGAFLDPDQSYVIDPMTKQIVPRDFLGSMTVRNQRPPGGGAPPVDPRVGI